MRISDWSSDVCSSDLGIEVDAALDPAGADLAGIDQVKGSQPADRVGFLRLGLEVLEGGREERQTRSYPIVEQAALETDLVIGGDFGAHALRTRHIGGERIERRTLDAARGRCIDHVIGRHLPAFSEFPRSEERRVGKECLMTRSSRGSPDLYKK